MLRSQALKWEMEHMSHESKSFLPTQLLKSIRQNPHLVPRICATHGLSFTVSKYKTLLFPKNSSMNLAASQDLSVLGEQVE